MGQWGSFSDGAEGDEGPGPGPGPPGRCSALRSCVAMVFNERPRQLKWRFDYHQNPKASPLRT